MITGSIDAVDAVKARKVGANDYCAKSTDFLVLIEAVKKLI
jgi:FixJ family two-component response regulator